MKSLGNCAMSLALLLILGLGVYWVSGRVKLALPGPAPTATSQISDLENTEWGLVSLNGKSPIEGVQITISFLNGKANGNAGCNTYNGKYPPDLQNPQGVAFAVTVKECTPRDVMEQEKAYLEVLWSSADYRVEGDTLQILDPKGKTVLVFNRLINTSENPIPIIRIDINAAEQLLRAWYEKENPDFNPAVKIPLKDLTTDEIWNRLGVQVFQVSGDIYQYDTFLIRNRQVLPMGTGFGGMGVTSMIVTDLDQDGQPELLYAYSFGSGIHQSHLGLYSPALTGNSTIEANTRYVDGDLLLVKVDDQRVNIKAAGADPLVEALTIGHPALVSEGGQARLFLQLNANLPSEVVSHIVENVKPTATPDMSLYLTQCQVIPGATAIATVKPSETHQGWNQYNNSTYSFSFSISDGWVLVEGPNYLCAMQSSESTQILIIGFKRAGEGVTIQRSEVGPGDISKRGSIRLFGQEISRDVQVYQGKDKAVLYNNAQEVQSKDLVFTFSLYDFFPDYGSAELKPTLQGLVDQIVESFQITAPAATVQP